MATALAARRRAVGSLEPLGRALALAVAGALRGQRAPRVSGASRAQVVWRAQEVRRAQVAGQAQAASRVRPVAVEAGHGCKGRWYSPVRPKD